VEIYLFIQYRANASPCSTSPRSGFVEHVAPPVIGIHRHGDDAVPGAERHGGADRAAGARLHPVRALQQGERAALARLQREDGPGVRLELPHLAHERQRQVTYTTEATNEPIGRYLPTSAEKVRAFDKQY
jgi:hypothetical protein